METPFFGGSYTSLSPNLADNRCMNLIPEVVETKEGKQIGGFYSTPGQRLVQSLPNSGTGYVAGPMRGVHAATNKMLVAVFGNQVVQIDQNQNVTPLGHLNTASGPVSIIDNGSQYAVFDYFQGWSWSGSVWAQITTIPNFPGSATQQDGYGVVGIWGTNQFYQSNLDDLTTWDPLNFSSADADASNLQAVISLYRQLWLVKEKSIEIWNNAGLNGFVFQRMEGAFMNVGCAAPASVATSEDHVFWLGQSDKGSLVVYMNNGYTEVRISTHAVEYALQSYLSLSSIGVADALGFCYTQAGHTYYVLTFPQANHTWVYDYTTKLWHERGEFINGSYARWDPSCYAYFAKQHIVGSSTGQQLSSLDLLYPLDDLPTSPPVNAKRWYRRWRALKNPINKPVRLQSLTIDMQKGIPTDYPGEGPSNVPTIPILTVSGHLPNGTNGVAITFPYTITSTFSIKTVAVTGGALPNGLSISNQGVVTGTYTTIGSFNWQITVTDVLGNTFIYNDSNTVSYVLLGQWALLATGNPTSVWFGSSPASFPIAATMSPGMNPTGSYDNQIQWNQNQMLYSGGTSSGQIATIANQNFTTSINNTVQTAETFAIRIRNVGNILFELAPFQVSTSAGSYKYSSDGGSTWNTATTPSGTCLNSIVKLNNGTWIAYFTIGATTILAYSTQTVPTSWTTAVSSFPGTPLYPIGTDGTTAILVDNLSTMYTSTNGITWSNTSYPEANTNYQTFGIAGGSTGHFVAQSVTNGKLLVSSNSGSSWTAVTVSTASSTSTNVEYSNGVFFATFLGTTQSVVYSNDNGSTWNVGTLPSGFTGNPIVGYL